MVICFLRASKLILSVSMPSIRVSPSTGIKRRRAKARVDLPDPVLPMTPTRSPDLIERLILSRTTGPSTE